MSMSLRPSEHGIDLRRLYDGLYVYQPLDVSKQEIRLVTVLPELSPDGLIQCQLTHQELSNTHIALSYTWGSSARGLPILVNDRLFQVRENLWHFLERTRRTCSQPQGIGLFIDAISIDQSNLAERGHQVQIMGSIYSNALYVTAWLGKGRSDIEEVLGLIDFGRRQINFGGKITERITVDWRKAPTTGFNASGGMDWGLTPHITAVMAICSLAYFRRCWIVQELYLARNVIVMCGQTQCRWSDLLELIRVSPAAIVPRLMDTPLYAFVGQRGEPGITHLSAQQQPLAALLARFKDRECSDFHDTVFAFLSLTPANGPFPVDYQLSGLGLFTSTILFCITQLTENTQSQSDLQLVQDLARTLRQSLPFEEEIGNAELVRQAALLPPNMPMHSERKVATISLLWSGHVDLSRSTNLHSSHRRLLVRVQRYLLEASACFSPNYQSSKYDRLYVVGGLHKSWGPTSTWSCCFVARDNGDFTERILLRIFIEQQSASRHTILDADRTNLESYGPDGLRGAYIEAFPGELPQLCVEESYATAILFALPDAQSSRVKCLSLLAAKDEGWNGVRFLQSYFPKEDIYG